jgi:hypothetical protein
MEEDEMMFHVAEEARKEMLLSGFKKAIHPKPTDLGLWKKGQVHESRGINSTIYKCPMSGRAGCRCMLRLVMAKDYLEFQRSELRHHSASHSQDDSNKLKYEQMVAIRDAVVTAPQLCYASQKHAAARQSHQDNSSRAHTAASSIWSTVPAKRCVLNN